LAVLEEVAQMDSKTGHEPAGSSPRRAFEKVHSVIRGDKYMVGAYPPEWHEREPATERPPVVVLTEAAGAEPAVPVAR
jgi:hypothetical protein